MFLIGFAASFCGSFVGGIVSVLGIAALIMVGMPPHAALGTVAFIFFGFDAGGLLQYHRNQKVVWRYVLPLVLVVVPSSIVGSLLVLSVEPELVATLVGLAMLMFIPLTFLKPDLGLVRETVSKSRERFGYIANALISTYGASIAIGAGFFWNYALMYFFGLKLIESRATLKIPSFSLSVTKLVVFGASGAIVWQYGPLLFAGSFLGAYVGTRYSIALGDLWLRRILLVVIAIMALKLVLGY